MRVTASSLLGMLIPWGPAGRRARAQEGPGPSGSLEIISVRPDRPHLVMPGTGTTFVVALSNPLPGRVTATIRTEAQSEGWATEVGLADRLFQRVGQSGSARILSVQGESKRYLIVSLSAQEGLPEEAIGTALVTSEIDGEPAGEVLLRAKIRSTPKIYFLAYDGLGRNYLKLDRRGKFDQVATNPLMPNVRKFAEESALLLKAKAHLPSFTDPNHVSVFTGSWPGTSGAIGMQVYYCGNDQNGDPVVRLASRDILRWGSDGELLKSVFEVAKDPEMGGSSDSMNVFLTGKHWMGLYVEDEDGTVDIISNGGERPFYVHPPEKYKDGDPLSDDDDGDRDGVNIDPLDEFHKERTFPLGIVGNYPTFHPDDRWIIESSLRIIAAEDPDVCYLLPGVVDAEGHHSGAADRPVEWVVENNPNVQWDNLNVYNLHANCDPMLDIVHEADAVFGIFVEALKDRGIYDDCVLTFLSDHGHQVYMDRYIDIMQICLDAGIPEEAFALYQCRAEVFQMWLADPSYATAIEEALESHVVEHPVLGKEVNPIAILNREEMETGVDGVLGPVAQSAGPRRSELYSEWYADFPEDDNTKPVWPDIMGFVRYHYQGVYTTNKAPFIGGHGGIGWVQSIPLIFRGPGIKTGVFTETAYLVDIAPTLYRLLGWTTPENVDGRILSEILE